MGHRVRRPGLLENDLDIFHGPRAGEVDAEERSEDGPWIELILRGIRERAVRGFHVGHPRKPIRVERRVAPARQEIKLVVEDDERQRSDGHHLLRAVAVRIREGQGAVRDQSVDDLVELLAHLWERGVPSLRSEEEFAVQISVALALHDDLVFGDFVLKVMAPFFPALYLGVRQYMEQKGAVGRMDRLIAHANRLWNDAIAGRSESELVAESRALQDEILEHRRASPLVFDKVFRWLRPRFESQMNYAVEHLVEEARAARRDSPG